MAKQKLKTLGVVGDKNWQELVEKGKITIKTMDNNQWELGDLANEVTEKYGREDESLPEYADEIDYNYNTLKQLRFVSDIFESGNRLPLSWTHHYICSHTDNPEKWLKLALDNHWKIKELIAVIKKETGKDIIDPSETIYGRYQDIVISKQAELVDELIGYDNLTQTQLNEMASKLDIIIIKTAIPKLLQYFKKHNIEYDYYDGFKKKIEAIGGEGSSTGLIELFDKIKKQKEQK